MKKEQMSIIAAGVVTFIAMAAHDNWIGQLASWVAKKPRTNPLPNPYTLTTSGSGQPALGIGGTIQPSIIPSSPSGPQGPNG